MRYRSHHSRHHHPTSPLPPPPPSTTITTTATTTNTNDPNRSALSGGSVQPPTFSVGKMPLTVRSKMPLTVRGNVWEISITRSGSNNVVEMVFPINYPLLQKNDFISNQVLYRSIFSKQLLVLTTKWLHQKEDIRG